MHIDIVPNRNSPPAVLLRESYREGTRVRKRTLANLSALSAEQVDAIRRTLKGERLVPVAELFEIVRSRHHGHVQALRAAMKQLRFESLVASRPSRERDLIVAMVIARILEPASKLATTRWWHTTTLPEAFGVVDADEDDLYAALDWLITRQEHIEKKLAGRHLKEGELILYDLSSSYFEGTTSPLGALGYNRDGKSGKLQVNHGLLTDLTKQHGRREPSKSVRKTGMSTPERHPVLLWPSRPRGFKARKQKSRRRRCRSPPAASP